MDSCYAPYTKHHRYWTGLSLLVRCCLFTIFGISYDVHSNLFWIVIAVSLILLFRLCYGGKIYKKKRTAFLEIFFFSNLGSLAFLLIYNNNSCEALTISASLSMIAFTGMLIYHVHLEISKVSYCKQCKANIKLMFLKFKMDEEELEELDHKTPKGLSTTYINLRETLIDN